MKSTINNLTILAIALITGLMSCKDDPDIPEPTGTDYTDGVFVINEGSYGAGSGTLTFIKRDGTGLQQKVFQIANNLLTLGNVAQSMNVIGDSAFIVVNNANRIVVASKYSMTEITTIEDIYQPRYMVNLNDGRFAVSCWDNTAKIFDLASLMELDEIETGAGPEKMMLISDKLWILNQGGLSVDSTLTIYDLITGNKQTLQVHPRPTGIQMDNDGSLWVMCSGRKPYHPGGFSPSHLLRIDPESHDITGDFLIQQGEHDAISLEINKSGNTLFYLFKGDIYSFATNATQPADLPLVDYEGALYSVGYDPVENSLYCADALDYTQHGEVYKYNASSGIFISDFKAGIIPSGFYFTQ